MNNKFFTEKQASIAATLAGPIPAGIFIYLNYKKLGKDKEAYKTIVATLIFTILLFYGLIMLPVEISDSIPDIAFTAAYGLIVYLFYHYYMSAEVDKALKAGATKRSNWSVAGLSVLGLTLNLAIIFGIAMEQPFYPGEITVVNGNELYYDTNVPPADVDKFLLQLQEQDFFGPEYGNIARLQYDGQEYFITLAVDQEIWSDQSIINYLSNLKLVTEGAFGKPTYLKLESIDLSGHSKFKTIK